MNEEPWMLVIEKELKRKAEARRPWSIAAKAAGAFLLLHFFVIILLNMSPSLVVRLYMPYFVDFVVYVDIHRMIEALLTFTILFLCLYFLYYRMKRGGRVRIWWWIALGAAGMISLWLIPWVMTELLAKTHVVTMAYSGVFAHDVYAYALALMKGEAQASVIRVIGWILMVATVVLYAIGRRKGEKAHEDDIGS